MTQPNSLTLGSLFDGIGGFPYAAFFYGITPLWASEILPTAISVTRRHFPDMAHVGDIIQLKGGKLPPVDIITFGSPCQGLSMAGLRLGLADERSGLFNEAIRIIREMRGATNGEHPKIALWENVPGALSTAGGNDFKAVLEAFTAAKVPMPQSGKWANAGMVRSRGADIAWCVYGAHHFGVAQRRRRIFLVADFTGQCAGEILFIPKSLRRYFEAGGTPRQAAAAYAENRAGTANECLKESALTDSGQTLALAGTGSGSELNPANPACAAFMGGQSSTSGGIGYSEQITPTLKSGNSGTNMTPCICEPALARTLTARGDSSPCADRGQNVVAVEHVLCAATGQANAEVMENRSATLVAGHEQPYIAHPTVSGTLCGSGAGLSRAAGMANEKDLCVVSSVDCRNLKENGDISGVIQSKTTHGYSLNYQNPVRIQYTVRRLIPIECERLMGFPDGWTEYGHDGKLVSDSKRYQMLGNSIAVPCAAYIMEGITTALSERR